jgi:F-type H+-transporting ATPase subunit delta
MSQDTIVAKRYARALFELAKDQNKIAQVEEELNSIVAILKENADFNKLIKHPGIGASHKAEGQKKYSHSLNRFQMGGKIIH